MREKILGVLLGVFIIGTITFSFYMMVNEKIKNPIAIRQNGREWRSPKIDSIDINSIYFKDQYGNSITVKGNYSITIHNGK